MIFDFLLVLLLWASKLIVLGRRHQDAAVAILRRMYSTAAWHVYTYRKTKSTSRPIASGGSSDSNTKTHGLLRLPPELRLRIYHYTFPGHRVVQPEFRNGKMRVRLGLLSVTPDSSDSNLKFRYIRSRRCAPSNVLRMTLEENGSFLHQSSRRIPSTKLGAGRLICGDGDAWYADQCADFFGHESYAALLKSNRTLYREVLDELYGKHTFSFFGPQMLQFFIDNASPEGVQLVRNVHLAIPISSEKVALEKTVSDTGHVVRHMATAFPKLRHLDVEVMFYGTSPSVPGRAWAKIRDDLFNQLRFKYLRDIVFTASILHKIPKEGKLSGWCSNLLPLNH